MIICPCGMQSSRLMSKTNPVEKTRYMTFHLNVKVLSWMRLTVPSKIGLIVFVLICFQTEVELKAQVPQTGRYVFMVHYCQPEHTTFPVEVLLDSGETWTGEDTLFKMTLKGMRFLPSSAYTSSFSMSNVFQLHPVHIIPIF